MTMWSSKHVLEMDTLARFYQQSIIEALGYEAKRRLNKGYHPLSEALAQVVGWRKRFLVADENTRQSWGMFQDWLTNVHDPADVYSEWLTTRLDERYQAQTAPERSVG